MAVSDNLIGQIIAHLARGCGPGNGRETSPAARRGRAVMGEPEVAPQQIATILAFAFGNRMLPDGNRQPVPIDEALAEITLLALGSLHSDTRQIGVLTGAEAMEEVCLMRAKGRGSGRRRTPSRSERDPNSRSLSRVDAVRDGPSAEALLFRKHPSLSGDQRFECPFLRHCKANYP